MYFNICMLIMPLLCMLWNVKSIKLNYLLLLSITYIINYIFLMQQSFMWILPWDIPKDSDTKANPLSSNDTVLEGGHNSWDEVLDTGEAILAHTPWLIHQKHYVCLYHRPACWGKRKGSISVCMKGETNKGIHMWKMWRCLFSISSKF